jgi:hypothetical protein
MAENEKTPVELIELTVENIEKAFETLNIEKAKKEEGSTEEKVEKESKETKEKVENDKTHEKKETEEEGLEDDAEDEDEKEMKKALSEKEKELEDMKKAYELKKAGKKDKKKEDSKIEKAEDFNIQKSIDEAIQPILKPIQKLIEINKSLSDELSSTKEEIEKANKRIESLEKQPVGRKSFLNTQFIEKAFQENAETGKKQLSMSQHKNEINNVLDSLAFEKGQMNELYANGISMYQSSGVMPEDVIRDLFAKHNIQIVK